MTQHPPSQIAREAHERSRKAPSPHGTWALAPRWLGVRAPGRNPRRRATTTPLHRESHDTGARLSPPHRDLRPAPASHTRILVHLRIHAYVRNRNPTMNARSMPIFLPMFTSENLPEIDIGGYMTAVGGTRPGTVAARVEQARRPERELRRDRYPLECPQASRTARRTPRGSRKRRRSCALTTPIGAPL